ncbi:hypothetical protein [Photobacterium swingsii]|uniref:hypothetical protein n=1 Tax=Photobacterium swingsii TaxID=680026 RepID=UPI0040693356
MHELYLESFTPELGIECFQCQQAETQCLLAISEHKIQVHQNPPATSLSAAIKTRLTTWFSLNT